MSSRTWDVLIEAAKAGQEAALAAGGFVMPPALYLLIGDRLLGYVRLRPVYQGQDAATAIAEMSHLAAAACATEVVAFWETQDIAAACEHVPLHPGPALNAVRATAAGHVVHRFPYRERRLPGRTEEGLWSIEPCWMPHPPPEPDGELEPAIAALLAYCWKPLDLDHPDPLDVTAEWLRSEGYTVKFVVPR